MLFGIGDSLGFLNELLSSGECGSCGVNILSGLFSQFLNHLLLLALLFLVLDAVDDFLEVFREVHETKTEALHILDVVLENQESSLVVDSDLDEVREAGQVDNVFTVGVVQGSQETDEVVDLDLGVELG